MKDKYGFDLSEGDIVAVSSVDNFQNYFFTKTTILEIDYGYKKHLAKVDYNNGVWVSPSEIILIQRS